jgi:hypothetical protein
MAAYSRKIVRTRCAQAVRHWHPAVPAAGKWSSPARVIALWVRWPCSGGLILERKQKPRRGGYCGSLVNNRKKLAPHGSIFKVRGEVPMLFAAEVIT